MRKLIGCFLKILRRIFAKIADYLDDSGIELVSQTLTIDYSRSQKQMIEAGKYDYVNWDINEKRFPISGQGCKRAILAVASFSKGKRKFVGRKYVLAKFKRLGLRPARPEEILALGEMGAEYEFPVIALGALWQAPSGHAFAIALENFGGLLKRVLGIQWCGGSWPAHYGFAAVPKNPRKWKGVQ